MYCANRARQPTTVVGRDDLGALGTADEKDHQHRRRRRAPTHATGRMRSSDGGSSRNDTASASMHDVADQLEHPLERQRRENLRALHVRRARDEHDARRFAAVGDEHVVQARAGERRLERHPEGLGADGPQEDPPANAP